MSKTNKLHALLAATPTATEARADRQRIRELEKLLESAQETIKGLRKPRPFTLPTRTGKARGTFTRVILADTHGCFANAEAIGAALADIKRLRPREIVLMGDHLDCAGWMAQHHPFKTIQESRYAFVDDVAAANGFLDSLQAAAPGATIHYLEGNHEERIEAWIVESTGRHPRDAEYLRTMFSPEVVLSLAKRQITYYRRIHQHCGLRVRGVLKLGHCCFVHGIAFGKNAARAHLDKLKTNVVFAHCHRAQQAMTADTKTEYGAWCPGCLCEFEPIYRHGDPTDWTRGEGVQLVNGQGEFLHLNVPIIDGRSFLQPLLEPSR